MIDKTNPELTEGSRGNRRISESKTMNDIYCSKCKDKTENIGGETKAGKRGSKYYLSKCKICGSKKSKMINGPTKMLISDKQTDYGWYKNIITEWLTSLKFNYKIKKTGEDSMNIYIKNYDETKFNYGIKEALEDIPNYDGDGIQINNPRHIRDIYFLNPDMRFSFYHYYPD